MRVGEAVPDMAIRMNLPVRARFGQLLPKRDDLFRRDHRIVPAMEGYDLCLILLSGETRRIEQAMETDRRDDVRAAPRKIERTHAAKAIAGGHDLARRNLIETAREI